MGIFQTGVDFDAGTATNGSAATVNSDRPLRPGARRPQPTSPTCTPCRTSRRSPVSRRGANLLVLSQEDGPDRRRSTAPAPSPARCTIVSDPGNPLSVPNQQHEGLTMDHDGNLYVVSENGGGVIDHPQLWVYAPSAAPNQAPDRGRRSPTRSTSIAREHQHRHPPEGRRRRRHRRRPRHQRPQRSTGPDAGVFEVDSNGLYLKAGTVLDFETKTSYTVAVAGRRPVGRRHPRRDERRRSCSTVTDVRRRDRLAVRRSSSPRSRRGAAAAARYGRRLVRGDQHRHADRSTSPAGRWTTARTPFGSSVALARRRQPRRRASRVVFVEGDATNARRLQTAWFGASAPAGSHGRHLHRRWRRPQHRR